MRKVSGTCSSVMSRDKKPAGRTDARTQPDLANPSRQRDAFVRGSIVISSSACHAEDPESTPGRGASTHTTPTNARGSHAQLVAQRREREPNRDRRAEASARRERQTTNTRTSNKNRQCKKRQLANMSPPSDRGDSNPCGQSPMDFESISLTARTQCLGR